MTSVYKHMKWNHLKDHMNLKSSDISAQLEFEVKTYSRLSTLLWYGHIYHLYAIHKAILSELRTRHKRSKRDQILQQIIGSYINDPDLGSTNFSDVGSNHKNISKEKRKNEFYHHLLNFSDRRIEDEKYIHKAAHAPILFEDSYVRGDSEDCFPKKMSQTEAFVENLLKGMVARRNPQNTKCCFAFLCHGFQGSHLDMLKLAHYFKHFNHEVSYIVSRCNEADTTIGIEKLGERLAKEVEAQLKPYIEDGRLGTVSFVGHSLGGLIIRAALPHLSKYKDHMKTFMTFSSPHLGVSSGDSMLVETGICLLLRFLDPHFMEEIHFFKANGAQRQRRHEKDFPLSAE